MKKDSRIFIVGHNDILERSLFEYLKKHGFSDVTSSSDIGLNTTIQSSVYHFFSEKKPEYVFLGSVKSGGIKANTDNPAEFIYSNLESQNNVVYSSHKFGVTKLLFMASSCVYPKVCAQPMKEEYIGTGLMEDTSSAYSTAKLAGIKLCQSYRKQYGMNAVVMLPATVYGPGCRIDVENSHVIEALISKFSYAVRNNEREVMIWGSGEQRREFLYKNDFVDACLFVMNKYDDDTVVNVGSGYDVSIAELAKIIKEVSGFSGDVVFDRTKPDGTMQKLLDSSRINSLGWKSTVELVEGIKSMYEFVKKDKG
jgi:GDP-L-fucose synthase